MDKEFKTLVIGGGIVGAGIFWDLSLHGIDTLLVDRGDFASQTSQNSSKMLHGGIRYLENMDFNLVFEALHEKNLWKHLMPELCYEKPFLLPIYNTSKYNLFMTGIGLFAYDLLSSFQNSPYKILSKQQSLEMNPALRKDKLKGSGVYHDVIVDDAKLNIEIILDALAKNKNSQALNYKKVTKIVKEQIKYQVTLTDSFSGCETQVTVENIVTAVGPFTDQFLNDMDICPWENQLLPSKGIHVWLKKDALNINAPIVLQTKDGRIIFVIPHPNAILVGTTESDPEKDFFNIKATQKDIDYIIDNLNEYFKPTVSVDMIISSFAGVRPLAKDDESSLDKGKTSREHKTLQPFSNFFVIVGGKYTTFRVMGQDITRKITTSYQKSYSPLKTAQGFTPHSKYLKAPDEWPSEDELKIIIKDEMPKTLEDLINRRLSVYSPAHNNAQESVEQFVSKHKDFFNQYGLS